MPLHLVKLAVGCESVRELKGWVAERMQAAKKKGLPLHHIHITRMVPKRVEELLVSERPSLILLDVVMPERNGFQVCRELKGNAEFSGIPIVLVTSKDTASDRYWGEQQGADGYVTKPFTREELLRAVRRFA